MTSTVRFNNSEHQSLVHWKQFSTNLHVIWINRCDTHAMRAERDSQGRDEDDQVDVWCFPERKTEMRMIRWVCGVSLRERQR